MQGDATVSLRPTGITDIRSFSPDDHRVVIAFSQQFTDEVEIGGGKLDGSDSTAGVLTIGASTTIGRRALLDVALDVGLNNDAADYAVRVAMPVRFDLPLP